MEKTSMRRKFRLVFLLACLAYAGSWAAGQAHSARDRSVVVKMTEKMKTVCAGRYLIDVPAQAVVSTSDERIDGFSIETVEESEASFRQRIAARELQLQLGGDTAEGAAPGGIVDAHDLRIPGMVGRTVVYGRTRSHGIENGRRVDALSFSLSAKYADESDAKAAAALSAGLQLRGEDEMPMVGGFCVWRAVFAEPLPAHQTEHIATHTGLPGHPDLAFTFVSMPGGGSDANLIARTARIPAGASAEEMLRVTKVRSNRRDIPGAREFNSTTTYNLDWETAGEGDNILFPCLSLEAHGGIGRHPRTPPAGSSLHEDASLALWDRIASSIRLRKENTPPRAQPLRLPAQRLSAHAHSGPKVAHNA